MNFTSNKIEFFNYLTINDEIANWGVHAVAVGFQNIEPNQNYPKVQLEKSPWNWNTGRILQDFALIFITSGSGIFESIDIKKRNISQNTILLIPPGNWHRYRPLQETGWEENWVIFNGTIPKNLLKNKILKPDSHILNCDLNDNISQYFRKLKYLSKNEQPGHLQTISALIINLLAELKTIEISSAIKKSKVEYIIHQAKLIMKEKSNQNIDIKDLAESLDVGYSWFRHMFKLYAGVSPANYHAQQKINHAKKLLLETKMSIKEIAAELDYNNQFYFSRVFKKIVGVTASDFRKNYL